MFNVSGFLTLHYLDLCPKKIVTLFFSPSAFYEYVSIASHGYCLYLPCFLVKVKHTINYQVANHKLASSVIEVPISWIENLLTDLYLYWPLSWLTCQLAHAMLPPSCTWEPQKRVRTHVSIIFLRRVLHWVPIALLLLWQRIVQLFS